MSHGLDVADREGDLFQRGGDELKLALVVEEGECAIGELTTMAQRFEYLALSASISAGVIFRAPQARGWRRPRSRGPRIRIVFASICTASGIFLNQGRHSSSAIVPSCVLCEVGAAMSSAW